MGIGRNKTELERDLSQLTRFWKNIRDAFKKAPRPGHLFLEQDVVVRSVRDYFSTDTEEVLIDSAEAFQRATAYVQAAMKGHQPGYRFRPNTAQRSTRTCSRT